MKHNVFISFIIISCIIVPFKSAMTIEISVSKGEPPTVYVSGEIALGDAKKLENVLKKNFTREYGGPKVVLNSNGGNYYEGINMGMAIFRNASPTLVEKDGMCMSACALAFLGGNECGGNEWLCVPSRTLEVGATLGFHPFYSTSDEQVNLNTGIESGRLATNYLYGYLSSIGIKPDLMIKIMNKSSRDWLIVNTPYALEYFNICLHGFTDKPNITNQKLVGIAKKIVSGGDERSWSLNAIKARDITLIEFQRDILNYVANLSASSKYPVISNIINKNLQNHKGIKENFEMLAALGTIPEPWTTSGKKIVKITGLNNLHHYHSKIAYFFVNEGLGNPTVHYWLCPPQDVSSNPAFEEGSLKDNGIIYDLYPPYTPLWSAGLK